DNGVAANLDGEFVIRAGRLLSVADALVEQRAQVGDIVCNATLQRALGLDADDVTFPGGANLRIDARPFLDGCVPLNLFGNRFLPEAGDFVSLLEITSSNTQQRIYQANLGGDIFELPGGAVSFAVSYLNRKETGVFSPDGLNQLELGQNSPTLASSGTFSTDEIGMELFVPILKDGDVPFINEVTFNPKVRYVDNSIAGVDYTYTLGGTITMFDMLTLRGNFTKSIRAPAIQELFDPTFAVRGFLADPCSDAQINTGPEGDDPNSTRRRNCAAVGITDPENHTNNSNNLSIAGVSSGNTNLRNETGNSYSFGFAISPDEYIPGFRLSVDYLNIGITDRIQQITALQAIRACFDSPNFPEGVCDAHTRDASGQIVAFAVSFQNASNSTFEAVQINTRYDFDVADALGLISSDLGSGDWGDFSIRVGAFRRITDIFQIVPGVPINNTVGAFGNPKWSGNVDFVYNNDKFRAFWRMGYTGRDVLDTQNREALSFFDADGNEIDSLNDKYIHNLTLSYRLSDTLTVSSTINNLFDRKPTITELAYNGFLFAETLGRNFTFSFRAAF
ncbi:MAG: TonB-dependent receptor, partial [Kordiimonadaceae bacterium]|nr:TonB-dependent receptor [Kordiimonadaceae bacterium]